MIESVTIHETKANERGSNTLKQQHFALIWMRDRQEGEHATIDNGRFSHEIEDIERLRLFFPYGRYVLSVVFYFL
jgi:hypothetical protein